MPTKKELRLYGDLIYHHKPTIKSILWAFLLDLFERKKRYKHPVNKDNRSIIDELEIGREVPIDFVHMALVQNGKVMEMIKTNEYVSKLLKNRKTKIVVFDPRKTIVEKGMTYSDDTFVIGDGE